MRTADTDLAIQGPDLAPHHRRLLARRHDPALDDARGAVRHGPEVGRRERAADVAGVEEAGPRDRQERRRGEGVEDGGRGAAVQVAALVAQLRRDGEGPFRRLRRCVDGDEPRGAEGPRVEAVIVGVGGERGVQGLDAVEDGQREVGSAVGVFSHFGRRVGGQGLRRKTWDTWSPAREGGLCKLEVGSAYRMVTVRCLTGLLCSTRQS